MHANVASTPHLRRIGTLLSIGAVAAILFATLRPDPGQPIASHLCLICGPFGAVDSVLNVLLFAPLGVGLALTGAHWNRSLVMACALSVAVETAQLAFVPGRDATLGDVITNTIGAALAFALVRHTRSWLRPAPRTAAILAFAWCAVWLIIQVVSSFAFALSIPASTYFGQIARELSNYDVFRGRVVSASLDNVVVTDTRLDAGDSIAQRLRGGGIVAAAVVPAGLTVGIAPIVRVADSEQREIALLAQDGERLLYAVRTGSAIVRLRPPLFAMRGVFTPIATKTRASGHGALVLGATYDGREARLTTQRGSESHYSRISVSSSLGWTLILPFQWYIENTNAERVVSWIWLAALMLPVGYWGAKIARSSDPRDDVPLRVVCLLGIAAVMIAGLGLVRYAFGSPAAPFRDWLGMSSGIVIGVCFAMKSGGMFAYETAVGARTRTPIGFF